MATEAFLKLGDLRGESEVKGFEGHIQLLSWDWGMSQASTLHVGSGGGAGAVEVEDLGFRHEIDAASPGLVLACCKGTHFSQGTLTFRKAGGTPLPFLTVKLRDIIVTSIAQGEGTDSEHYAEDVTLNFATFAVSYQKQDSTGTKAGGAVTIECDLAKGACTPPKKEPLRRGSTGAEVQQLQLALTERGFPVSQTGFYGHKTEAAVRAFQMKYGLLSDGVVGSQTRATLECLAPSKEGPKSKVPKQGSLDLPELAHLVRQNIQDLARHFGLEVQRGAKAALHRRPDKPMVEYTRNIASIRISDKGLGFILQGEIGKNSLKLHHPSDGSGVTLGPGYDMKDRKPPQIVAHLTAIGIDRTTAEKISKAAGLSSRGAKQFVHDNQEIVTITRKQEVALLRLLIPSYEAAVRKAIRVELMQHQFDALVSFCWTAGSVYERIARPINQGKMKQAMEALIRCTTSGGVQSKGLKNRRTKERALFINGDYGDQSSVAL